MGTWAVHSPSPAAADDGPAPTPAAPGTLRFADAKRRVLRAFETELIERKLRENKGNISKTAEALGMHRQSLQQKLRELGIVINKYRD